MASDLSDNIGLKKRCQPSTQEITDFHGHIIETTETVEVQLSSGLNSNSTKILCMTTPNMTGMKIIISRKTDNSFH